MSHRTTYGDFVRNLSGMFEIFTEMNTWDLGLDALERATIFERCVWLGVPRLLMSHSSGKINVNYAFGRTIFGFIKFLGSM